MFKMVSTFMYVIIVVMFIGFVLIVFTLFGGYKETINLNELERVAVEITDNLMVSGMTLEYGIFNFTEILKLNSQKTEPVHSCGYGTAVRFTFRPKLIESYKSNAGFASLVEKYNMKDYGVPEFNYVTKQPMIHFGYFGPSIRNNAESYNNLNHLQEVQQTGLRTGSNDIIVPVVMPSGDVEFARLSVIVFDDFLSRIGCAIEQASRLPESLINGKKQMIEVPVICIDTDNCRFNIIPGTSHQVCIEMKGSSVAEDTYCRQLPVGIALKNTLAMPYENNKDVAGLYISAENTGSGVKLSLASKKKE